MMTVIYLIYYDVTILVCVTLSEDIDRVLDDIIDLYTETEKKGEHFIDKKTGKKVSGSECMLLDKIYEWLDYSHNAKDLRDSLEYERVPEF